MAESKEEKDLWKTFSEWIRRRDAYRFSGGDIVKCITCKHVEHWKKFDCGHFVSRRHKATKYSENNNHAQCKGCNGFGAGQQYKYSIALDKMYGNGTAAKIELKSRTTLKWGKFEFKMLDNQYKEKLKRNDFE